MSRKYRIHCAIPDTQSRPGVRDDHMEWIGNYIAEKRPDVITHLGDHADLPSLSSFAIGKVDAEGMRYVEDVRAAKESMAKLLKPIRRVRAYHPEMHLTVGNHEHRIQREAEANPRLIGKISIDDLCYKEQGWRVHPFLEVALIDGVEYCLEETTRVLTADLRWVPIGALAEGDSLVGFDEHRVGLTLGGKESARRYRSSLVEKLGFDRDNLYEVTLSDGTVVRATAEHQWLANRGAGLSWHETTQLIGARVPRLMNTWSTDESRDAGWLAGFMDGEGYITKPNSAQGGLQVGFGQNPGQVLDRAISQIQAMGFRVLRSDSNKCVGIKIAETSGRKLEFLGRVRPGRVIANFQSEMLGRLQSMNYVDVVSVKPCGVGTIVKIRTSTRTLIADGFPHHNCHFFTTGVMGRPASSAAAMLRQRHRSCVQGHVQKVDIAVHPNTQQTALMAGICYLHDESYLSPQGQSTKRGIWMFHEVHEGRFDIMAVSLDFLRRRYS